MPANMTTSGKLQKIYIIASPFETHFDVIFPKSIAATKRCVDTCHNNSAQQKK